MSAQTKLSCWVCKKPISGARTVIEGKWHCGDCTYLHDHPEVVVPPPCSQAAHPEAEGNAVPAARAKATAC